MSRNKRKRQRPSADDTAPPTASNRIDPHPAGASRRGARWGGRLAIAVAVPLLLLLAAEGILRLSGFGYDPHYFARTEDSRYVGSNAEFGQTYFPAAIARKPTDTLFLQPKAPGTYRVFVLGSSAAIGVPDAAFSFGRVLRAMLEQSFPGVRFEVVTAGITATNSHVALPIARECAAYDPDLFLVYLGNNEVIGPFGIQTARGGDGPGLDTIRTAIALRRWKLGQLMQRASQKLAGQDRVSDEWRGMGMYLDQQVRAEAPALERIYAHYEHNVRDICAVAREAGVPIVLCTVASNLADSPPFGSLHRTDLGESELREWERLVADGRRHYDAGDHQAALALFSRAATIDDTHADLRYLIGRCHHEAGALGPALEAYRAARWFDTLRFRADRRLNDTLRSIAGQPGVHLADCQRAFEDGSGAMVDIPGRDEFFEHVHLTFAGNHALASVVFPTVVGRLPASIRRRAAGPVSPPSLEDCARALAYTPWNEYRMIAQMVGTMLPHPPFTGQIGHAETMAYWQQRLEHLRAARSPEQGRAIIAIYDRALRRRPDDVLLAIKYATLLAESGNGRAAASVVQGLLRKLPAQSPLAVSGVTAATM